jgi:lipoyl(octanoyl) transferase
MASDTASASGKKIIAVDLGLTDYRETWRLQQQLFQRRLAGEIPDLLLLNEHRHVYTFGKSSDENHLLASERQLRDRGIAVVPIDRGGDVTYHGPGQLVGYPILNLQTYYTDIHRYLRDLEEVIIRTIAAYGVAGKREPEFTGVWVGGEKIAAIGVKVSHWITMHGFALNINTDLAYFNEIIPCGIFHKGVTSLAQRIGKEVALNGVGVVLAQQFGDVFGATIEQPDEEFRELLGQIIHHTPVGCE